MLYPGFFPTRLTDRRILEKTHIRICITKQNCIKGFFLPKNETAFLKSIPPMYELSIVNCITKAYLILHRKQAFVEPGNYSECVPEIDLFEYLIA
jgi:hypothetical protein